MEHKDDFILNKCKGKTVLHIGATAAPKHIKRAQKGILLHQKISRVSDKLIGLDYDKKSIKELKKYNINNIFYGDILLNEYDKEILKHNYDVIVLADVIEHIDNPGFGLQNIKKLMGSNTIIILTVPNVWGINRLKNHFKRKEEVHPEHMFWPSKITLNNIIKKNGLGIKEFHYCLYNSEKDKRSWKSRILENIIIKRFDWMSYGLLYVVKK